MDFVILDELHKSFVSFQHQGSSKLFNSLFSLGLRTTGQEL